MKFFLNLLSGCISQSSTAAKWPTSALLRKIKVHRRSCHLGPSEERLTPRRCCRNMYNRVSFTLRPRRFHLFSMSAVLSPHIIYRHIMCMCFPTNGEVCVCAAAYVRRHDCGLLCCWSSLCETASTRFAVCNAMQTSFQCRMQLSQTGGVCCNYQATARSFFLFTSSRRDAFKCNSQVATTARRARCLSAQQLINAHTSTSCTGLFVSKYRMLAGACGSVQKNAHPGK